MSVVCGTPKISFDLNAVFFVRKLKNSRIVLRCQKIAEGFIFLLNLLVAPSFDFYSMKSLCVVPIS